jgi:antitoxin PrlF
MVMRLHYYYKYKVTLFFRKAKMGKILQAKSTLTNRYQTTIPEAIRKSLHLNKRDKITYTIEENGKVSLSRADENDPILSQFLSYIVNDIKNNPTHVYPITPVLMKRAQSLVAEIDIDLDAPLDNEDE